MGALLGFLGGLFGIGGGIVAIPFLVLTYGMEQAVAQGTSLAMMVPVLLIGWWRYSRLHPIPVKVALLIGLVAAVSTLVVAYVATNLNSKILTIVFSIFLLFLAIRMLACQRNSAPEEVGNLRNSRLMPLVGILGGGCMGLLGIGGGLLATPIFTGYFGQKQTVLIRLSPKATRCSVSRLTSLKLQLV